MQSREMFWVGLLGLLAVAFIGVWNTPWEETREEARKSHSQDQLHNLAIGLLNYETTGGVLFPSTTLTSDIPPTDLHGWQTHMLPYIEQRPLHSRIALDRPWTDRTNTPHFQHVLDLYRNPASRAPNLGPTGLGLTDYSANTLVITASPMRLSAVTDGAENTIFAGEIGDNLPPWGQPRNVRDPGDGLYTSPNAFGGPWASQETQFSFLDGHIRSINRNIDPAVLKALATPAGGEAVKRP
jgi:hypothetical protein